MAGIVHLPWYATGLRAEAMAEGLARIAPVAMRYGATEFRVYRFRDDRYKFLQTATFDDKLDWERYWEGEEFIAFRVNHSGRYQVPLLYGWTDLISSGGLPLEPIVNGPADADEER